MHGTTLVQFPSRVATTQCGKALVAAADLGAGRVVGRFSGHHCTAAELPESEICYALWLNDDEWLIPTSTARFANHSCDPNCKVNDDLEVVTIRAVRQGEELTFTYNRVYPGETPPDWDPRWSFDCLCGAAECQRRIDGWTYA